MGNSAPLYNSRIIQTFIDYLQTAYPDVQIENSLRQAGMKKDEVADTGHWFTQDQIDQFYQAIVSETRDDYIARHAGRFGASAKGIGLLQQYVIGLINLENVFAFLPKVVSLFTRGTTIKVRRLGARKVEIVSEPNPGVQEKLFQCENRLGYFEALPKLFTNFYARIEHPECFHRGDRYCRYIVQWNASMSSKLKLIRNYATAIGALVLSIAAFSLSACDLIILTGAWVGTGAILSIAHLHAKSKELESVIESYHKRAEAQIDLANANYSNALLVQEIGQATAAVFDISELMSILAGLMQRYLPFDRGLILLSDEQADRLVYSAGYGYGVGELAHLQQTEFRLNNPASKGVFVRAFLDQKTIVVNNIDDIKDSLSPRSRELANKFDVQSFVCVPIVFETKPLGVVAVDNNRSKATLKTSDVRFLQGIASHMAISINNAISFQNLKKSEERYRQTLEGIAEGYFEIDAANKICFINSAFCALSGHTCGELADRSFDKCFHADSRQALSDLFSRMPEKGQMIRFAHFKMIRKGGEIIPVDLSASLILDSQDGFAGFRGLIRDATDRLNMEKEKQLLENRLAQAQKMEAIGKLAGGIAHNFNNWLTGIAGNAALIRLASRQNTKVLEKTGNIENIVESAARMTQQLLGYARGGKYRVDIIDVNQLIRQSSENFLTAGKDIAIRLKLTPDVAPFKADQSQIEQVLWNLYVNASDAMPEGGELIIETKNASDEDLLAFGHEPTGRGFIYLSITDSGIGIDPKDQEHIFEPFFTTKIGKGTGLGLASVFGIIKSYDGFIHVTSSRDKGSTFHMFLPADKNTAPVHADDNGVERVIKKGSGTILLVDDDPMILQTCSLIVSELGYTPLASASGKEALKIYAANMDSIALVIIDMIMPHMSGKELFQQLKAINPGVKTLLCSGYSMTESREILKSGCDGFIQKPFDMFQLSESIAAILHG